MEATRRQHSQGHWQGPIPNIPGMSAVRDQVLLSGHEREDNCQYADGVRPCRKLVAECIASESQTREPFCAGTGMIVTMPSFVQ